MSATDDSIAAMRRLELRALAAERELARAKAVIAEAKAALGAPNNTVLFVEIDGPVIHNACRQHAARIIEAIEERIAKEGLKPQAQPIQWQMHDISVLRRNIFDFIPKDEPNDD